MRRKPGMGVRLRTGSGSSVKVGEDLRRDRQGEIVAPSTWPAFVIVRSRTHDANGAPVQKG